MGEGEYENYSKELEAEKKDDEKIEAKIRQLRKEKNKARLHHNRDSGSSTKKRKIDENNYIDIQEVWKKPEITKQQKNKIQEDEQNNAKRAKKNEKVPTQLAGSLTNLRTIEKVITVQEWDETIQLVENWDEKIREHKKEIEEREQERIERLKRKQDKKHSWELARLCKEYLEENSVDWAKRKEQREIEKNKLGLSCAKLS